MFKIKYFEAEITYCVINLKIKFNVLLKQFSLTLTTAIKIVR